MGSLPGSRILVTRDEGPEGPLSTLLRQAGAVPLLHPTLEVVPLLDPPGRARELRRLLPGARWLVLTSPRAVALLQEAGIFDAPCPPGLRVAVAGTSTARAVEAAGWEATVVPSRAGAAPLLEAILAADAGEAPGTVVFPASARAADTLPDGLRRAGYAVSTLPLYEPRAASGDPGWWEALLRDGGVEALTFTSPSAVEGLTEEVGEGPVLQALRSLPAAVQGPTTAAAVLARGWERVAEAEPRTFPGLVQALETLLNHGSGVPE